MIGLEAFEARAWKGRGFCKDFGIGEVALGSTLLASGAAAAAAAKSASGKTPPTAPVVAQPDPTSFDAQRQQQLKAISDEAAYGRASTNLTNDRTGRGTGTGIVGTGAPYTGSVLGK